MLECNLDDTTPELIGALSEMLFEAGALDVFTVPVWMKKQRPGTLLTVLCKAEKRAKIIDLIFLESTTFGIRERLEKRTILAREFKTVTTPYGEVQMKIGKRNGNIVTVSPEFESCRSCAKKTNVSIQTVQDAAKKVFPSA